MEPSEHSNGQASSNLAKVHHIKSPLAKSPFNSVLKEWQNSIPKLYQYPPTQLQVTVQRKSGALETLTPGSENGWTSMESGRRRQKKSRLPVAVNGHATRLQTPLKTDCGYPSVGHVGLDGETTLSSFNTDGSTVVQPPDDSSQHITDKTCYSVRDKTDISASFAHSQNQTVPCDLTCSCDKLIRTELDKTKEDLACLNEKLLKSENRVLLLEKSKLQIQQENSELRAKLENLTIENKKLLGDLSLAEKSVLDSTLVDEGNKYSEKSIHKMIQSISSNTASSTSTAHISSTPSFHKSADLTLQVSNGRPLQFSPSDRTQKFKRNMQIITKHVEALNMSYLCDLQVMRNSLLYSSPEKDKKKGKVYNKFK